MVQADFSHWSSARADRVASTMAFQGGRRQTDVVATYGARETRTHECGLLVVNYSNGLCVVISNRAPHTDTSGGGDGGGCGWEG